MRTQLSSKESRWCNCGKQILTTDLRFIDKGVHICCECRNKELNAMKDEEKQTVASPIEPVVSCEFFKSVRNKVVSTTGDKVVDESICLIVYLYEQHKQSLNSN